MHVGGVLTFKCIQQNFLLQVAQHNIILAVFSPFAHGRLQKTSRCCVFMIWLPCSKACAPWLSWSRPLKIFPPQMGYIYQSWFTWSFLFRQNIRYLHTWGVRRPTI